MHYSRISTSPSQSYSAASAVLLNELLKGSISLAIAFIHVQDHFGPHHTPRRDTHVEEGLSWIQPSVFIYRCRTLRNEIFSPDCWKLSIPAILYGNHLSVSFLLKILSTVSTVIQNNLQFVAASNLDAATFQVSYQMKILTTAAFSVALLRKRLTPGKWFSLFCLALGVGIVQIQSGSGGHKGASHEMQPIAGFMAVTAACFTSGLAGVYFEKVLKGSKTNLWVRNVQLSFFSLLPALAPIVASSSGSPASLSPSAIFANFGPWAWATVLVQVFGGLVTALVIKYSDNILKAFATSLSIILASVASIALFDFQVTPSFVIGASTVLTATWIYSQPDGQEVNAVRSVGALPKKIAGAMSPRKASFPGTPLEPAEPDEPILGEMDDKRRVSGGVSPSVLSAALKQLVTPRTSLDQAPLAGHNEMLDLSLSVSSSSLSDIQGRLHSYSSSGSPSPVPVGYGTPGRLQPSSSTLSVPLSRSASSSSSLGLLHPPTSSSSIDESQYSIINLDDHHGAAVR